MVKLVLATILLTGLLFAGDAFATTYYISSSLGNDATSSGQSKSSPWAHLPGMVTCASKCAAYSPAAGDQFILLGCDVWTNANFPVLWQWSGSSGKNIYIGVDQSWYNATNCPSGWNRPIFDAGNSVITGSGTKNAFIRAYNNAMQYVTIDNIEMRNYFWNADNNYGDNGYLVLGGVVSGSNNITVTNNYLHHWTHPTPTGGTCGSGCTDSLYLINGDLNSPYMAGSVIKYNVIDGSDGDSDSGHSVKGFFGTMDFNVVHDVANAFLPVLGNGTAEVGNNHIYNLRNSFSGEHENAIETLQGSGTPAATFYIHDNVIHDLVIGEASMLGNKNETDYYWNNVVDLADGLGGGNPPHFPQDGVAGTAMYFWNNVVVPQAGVQCFLLATTPSPGWTAITMENNHCVTSGNLNSANIPATTLTIDHNALMTPTQAATAGYSYSETYKYSPVSQNCSGQPNCPVGAGINLSNYCLGALAGLCNDTIYACTQSASNQVSCPARNYLPRPSGSAAWDSASYMFSSVLPPQNLVATVH